MITMKELMMHNPPLLHDTDTVDQAKLVAIYSRLKCIPVVYQNGEFAGTLDKSLILQERFYGTSTLNNYLNEVAPVYTDDPISLFAKITVEPSASVLPVLSRDNTLAGVIPNAGFISDVYSEILKAEKSVDLYEDDDLMGYGIVIIDSEGKIVCFNRNAEIMLGIDARDIYGFHVSKILHDFQLWEIIKREDISPKSEMQSDQGVLCTSRFPLIKEGAIVGAMGVFQEVFERDKLNKSLKKLRGLNLEMVGIMESIHDGIVVTDNYGKVIKINAAFEFFTGLTANQILDAGIEQLVKWDYLPSVILTEVMVKKKQAHIIKNIHGKDLLITANPFFGGDGKLNMVVVVMKDIGYLEELILNLRVTQNVAICVEQEIEPQEPSVEKKDMIASSVAMKRIISLVQKVAQVDSNVLIMGETGVGKEVVARSIHMFSERMDGPFIKLNCGAIPEQLMESELFGYEAGAFTGAKKEGKAGLIELAAEGTLFLDEIGDLPMNVQVKLLRVLQEHEVIRVGGSKNITVDFRLIAATNKDLRILVKNKEFREDLFYRLNVVPVQIPPLRERKEDIVPLVVYFLNKFNQKYGFAKKISPEVIHGFLSYNWPGNIRELENAIERLVVTSETDLIGMHHLIENTNICSDKDNMAKQMPEVRNNSEKALILLAMQQCKNTREMARFLGVSQSTVVKKMKKYGIVKD